MTYTQYFGQIFMQAACIIVVACKLILFSLPILTRFLSSTGEKASRLHFSQTLLPRWETGKHAREADGIR